MASKSTEPTANRLLIGVPAGAAAKVSPSSDGDSQPVLGIPTPTTSTMSLDVMTSTTVVKDAFLGIPETDDSLLPDLVVNIEPTPEYQNDPMEGTQDIPSTEDEQNAVDTLLSLSIPSIAIEPDVEDNSLLVPIGGQAVCEDVAPTESRLGQVEVDREIARMVAIEEHTRLEKSGDHEQTSTLTGVPSQDPNVQPADIEQSALLGVQLDPLETQPLVSTPVDDESKDKTPTTTTAGNTGARPKTGSTQLTTGMAGKKGSKGAFEKPTVWIMQETSKGQSIQVPSVWDIKTKHGILE